MSIHLLDIIKHPISVKSVPPSTSSVPKTISITFFALDSVAELSVGDLCSWFSALIRMLLKDNSRKSTSPFSQWYTFKDRTGRGGMVLLQNRKRPLSNQIKNCHNIVMNPCGAVIACITGYTGAPPAWQNAVNNVRCI